MTQIQQTATGYQRLKPSTLTTEDPPASAQKARRPTVSYLFKLEANGVTFYGHNIEGSYDNVSVLLHKEPHRGAGAADNRNVVASMAGRYNNHQIILVNVGLPLFPGGCWPLSLDAKYTHVSHAVLPLEAATVDALGTRALQSLEDLHLCCWGCGKVFMGVDSSERIGRCNGSYRHGALANVSSA